MTTDRADRGGADGAELTLVIAAALYCGYGISQGLLAVALDMSRYPHPVPTVAVAAAVFAGAAAVIVPCVRAGAMQATLVTSYTAVLIAAVVLDAVLTRPQDGHNWTYFMYPVSLINSIMIGLTYRRYLTVIAATVALAGTYVLAAHIWQHDPLWNVLPNALSYPANTTVAWAVGHHLRRTGQRLDRARAESVAQAETAAAARAQARSARILHDRALQALEALARDSRITDPALRGHIARDAAWLRAYIERDPGAPGGDLVTALHELAQGKAAVGLNVELNIAQLRDGTVSLPPERQEALLGAAHEALTNVAKHAGVTHAAVRAHLLDGTLVLTVVDHGSGFTADAPRLDMGAGIRESIIGRLSDAGGTATVESTPGSGTVVRLSVPARTDIRAGADQG